MSSLICTDPRIIMMKVVISQSNSVISRIILYITNNVSQLREYILKYYRPPNDLWSNCTK